MNKKDQVPSTKVQNKKQTSKKYNPLEIQEKWPSSAKATAGKQKVSKYDPISVQKKWQEKWEQENLYKFDMNANGEPYYNLVELPYPSGDLHLGHWFSFVTADAHARYKKMAGFNVFFPNGFDAFGLPAENAAIKRGIDPKEWTMSNIKTMRKQFDTMGTMIDWSHEAITCLPEYYRWNQWIFLRMLEKGIAYRGKALGNWCPVDQTVLANEHVEAGRCWRCGSEVVQKEIEQWFLKLTAYADHLIWSDNPSVDWPKSVREGQNNWIGRSEGIQIEFKIQNSKFKIEVFTTRPETIDGATFLVIAPEHPLVSELRFGDDNAPEVMNYISQALAKVEQERLIGAKKKTGVNTGYKAINPVNGKEIPIYIADYVLGNYGTGAIMGVPIADQRDREFAEAYNLPIVETSFTAKPQGEKIVQYHIRDWSISRQRYWGTPIPVIHCDKCGIVPVPDDQLPVALPDGVDFTPKGEPPLATAKDWLYVDCPKCGGKAKRDAETMDTFFDSAWYYYRYLNPHFDTFPFDKDLAEKIMPVDVYYGGAEHTLGHTLYARFFTKFFKDQAYVRFDEFATKRVQHGVILGPDGNRMSKSKGNVVNPDDLVKEYGTDAVRTYLCFMMPYEATAPWSPEGIWGSYRFLKRIWELQFRVIASEANQSQDAVKKVDGIALSSKTPRKDVITMSNENLVFMHKTIKKVGEDLQDMKFNTAVAALMTWLNHLESKQSVSIEEYKNLLLLVAPFAPHMTEELWQELQLSVLSSQFSDASQSVISLSETDKQKTGKLSSENRKPKTDNWSIHLQPWPQYDEKYLVEDEVSIVVQINGKMRDSIKVQSSSIKDQDKVEEIAKKSQKLQKHLEGQSIKKVIYVPGKIINFVV